MSKVNVKKFVTKENIQMAGLEYLEPLREALITLGGGAAKQQVFEKVREITKSEDSAATFRTKLTWARQYLMDVGVIDGSERGYWKFVQGKEDVVINDELIDRMKELQVEKRNANLEKKVQKNLKNKADKENSMADDDVQKTRYWIYSPGDNASRWDEFYNEGIIAVGWDDLGDLTQYESKDDMREKMQECYGADKSYRNAIHATWQFCNEMNEGDIIFAKQGRQVILGKGIVESDYEFDDERDEYKHIRKINWLCSGQWKSPMQLAMKTLTETTQYTEDLAQLNALFEDEVEEDAEEAVMDYPLYTKENFLNEVFMEEKKYDTLVKLLHMKKNIILQGAPGVGKTFAAKRLAYSIMGRKDISRVEMVQFHQSYSYEDFVVGYRPTETGFKESYGPFYKFCSRAKEDLDNDYFFIIDEINRGNLSKIFGELFMLIEGDKRGAELSLLYVNEKFSVPKNVHIIGMMNTADRSLAMMDYALRRRFAFFEFEPAFNTDGFKEYQKAVNHPRFDALIGCVKELNAAIEEDPSLGRGFRIGHSYFVINQPKNADDEWLKAQVDDTWLSSVIDFELIPLLEEYWFDEPKKVEDWTARLRNSQKEAK